MDALEGTAKREEGALHSFGTWDMEANIQAGA